MTKWQGNQLRPDSYRDINYELRIMNYEFAY